MKFLAKANYDYKKWSANLGLAYESTSRDGQVYEKIELSSILFDFGVDFDLTRATNSFFSIEISIFFKALMTSFPK